MNAIIIHSFDAADRIKLTRAASSVEGLKFVINPDNPRGLRVFSNDQRIADSFAQQYEHNSAYAVLYPVGHSKHNGIPTHPQFRGLVASSPTGVAINYVPGYPGPGNAFASQMGAFYGFPHYIGPGPFPAPKIGICSLGGNYQLSDLQNYWAGNGNPLPYPTVTLTPVPNTYTPPTFGSNPNADVENAVDLETASGIATNAQLTFYSAANSTVSFYDVTEQAISDGMNFLSISWGAIEPAGGVSLMQAINGVMETAMEGGMVITVASGDGGCYCLDDEGGTSGVYALLYPSSSPYVVACGGTSLTGPVFESAWWNPTQEVGAGGGQSAYPTANPVPSFQTNLLVPSPIYPSTPARYTPDLAMNADPDSPWLLYLTYEGMPGYYNAGGTSFVAPFMAGYLGMLYATSSPSTLPRLGYQPYGFNHFFYQAPVNCINDIATGTNGSTQTSAVVGYDLATGLGSLRGSNLATFLSTYTCVAIGTRILMADGTNREIETIQSGDRIAGCYPHWQEFIVKRVLRQSVSPNSHVGFLRFRPGSLGPNIPQRNLLITDHHPIWVDHDHSYAGKYRNRNGVYDLSSLPIRNYLEPENGRYYLYDLQFTSEGSYLAEGLPIQSRIPRPTPLARVARRQLSLAQPFGRTLA